MPNQWLQLMQENPQAKANLLCLPFAGGNAEFYSSWRRSLPAQWQLCPIQLPGRSYRGCESVYTDMQCLLDNMLPGLIPLLKSRPYYLFGHSMGGYIAYAFCQRLLEMHLPLPLLLTVSAVPAPIDWTKRQQISKLTPVEFHDIFLNLGGFHPELKEHSAFMAAQMKLLRQDIMLCESANYTQAQAFPFSILALAGEQDEYVRAESMAAWSLETGMRFKLHRLPGKHFYLQQQVSKILEFMEQMND